ncbi:hypothetical protein HKD21_10160 [Gluconobacter cerevisiae]|uniref:Uncharacterized protein n=1 Tax=Gluconobacter cerevisiae TaxID=1379734 RepID=A0ABR9YEW3_9PROT|nr:hypothetical protein [Gluconobacter cerevisiae]MBF0877208.1 hypothetical protein [Gluconobacter cerevisiae]
MTAHIKLDRPSGSQQNPQYAVNRRDSIRSKNPAGKRISAICLEKFPTIDKANADMAAARATRSVIVSDVSPLQSARPLVAIS